MFPPIVYSLLFLSLSTFAVACFRNRAIQVPITLYTTCIIIIISVFSLIDFEAGPPAILCTLSKTGFNRHPLPSRGCLYSIQLLRKYPNIMRSL